ncbi:damage-inducible protein DinB [Spirochaetia bacterium]|nr:damage-inducible protein DinB [Spirochaetia bacterium]
MDMFLNIFKQFSKFNKSINVTLIKIIKENDEIYNKRISGYYKNVNDILFHILDVDLLWISRIGEVVDSKIFDEEIFKNYDRHIEPINKYKTIAEFEKDRIILDELIIKFVDEVNEKDLDKKMLCNNNRTRKVWELLLHTFNHQTHHRGQISEILDENGIKNDYSDM